jgi:hypothetical protein
MARTQPACPECGAEAEGRPDRFLVHRCGECGVEFRPPGRVPLRRVGSSQAPRSQAEGRLTWAVLTAVGIGGGLAIAVADSDGSRLPPAVHVDPIEIPEPPTFEPITLEQLQLDGFVELEVEVSSSQREQGSVRVTGVLRNPEPVHLRDVKLLARVRSAAGATTSHAASLACPQLRPGESCPWVVELPASVDARGSLPEPVYDATGWRSMIEDVLPPVVLRARFDARGHPLDPDTRLELDLAAETLSFPLAEGVSGLEPWATLTSYDASGEVLEIVATRWPALGSSKEIRPITLPAGEAVSYEVRVGGLSSQPPLGADSGLSLDVEPRLPVSR